MDDSLSRFTQLIRATGVADLVGTSPEFAVLILIIVAAGLIGGLIAYSIRKGANWRKIGDDIGRDMEVEDAAEKNFPTSQQLSEMEPTIPAKPIEKKK
jgi:hypothetical protein